MEKTIRKQIKEQPVLHGNYFACIGLAIVFMLLGAFYKYALFLSGCFSFLAAAMVVAAIIDTKK